MYSCNYVYVCIYKPRREESDEARNVLLRVNSIETKLQERNDQLKKNGWSEKRIADLGNKESVDEVAVVYQTSDNDGDNQTNNGNNDSIERARLAAIFKEEEMRQKIRMESIYNEYYEDYESPRKENLDLKNLNIENVKTENLNKSNLIDIIIQDFEMKNMKIENENEKIRNEKIESKDKNHDLNIKKNSLTCFSLFCEVPSIFHKSPGVTTSVTANEQESNINDYCSNIPRSYLYEIIDNNIQILWKLYLFYSYYANNTAENLTKIKENNSTMILNNGINTNYNENENIQNPSIPSMELSIQNSIFLILNKNDFYQFLSDFQLLCPVDR